MRERQTWVLSTGIWYYSRYLCDHQWVWLDILRPQICLALWPVLIWDPDPWPYLLFFFIWTTSFITFPGITCIHCHQLEHNVIVLLYRYTGHYLLKVSLNWLYWCYGERRGLERLLGKGKVWMSWAGMMKKWSRRWRSTENG